MVSHRQSYRYSHLRLVCWHPYPISHPRAIYYSLPLFAIAFGFGGEFRHFLG
jgi:hypothetical protein